MSTDDLKLVSDTKRILASPLSQRPGQMPAFTAFLVF